MEGNEPAVQTGETEGTEAAHPPEEENQGAPVRSPFPVLLVIAVVVGLCVAVASRQAARNGTTGVSIPDRFGRQLRFPSLPGASRLSGQPDIKPLPGPGAGMTEFLRLRTVRIAGDIDDYSARLAIAQLVLLNEADTAAPIRLHVDSTEGRIDAIWAILDAMDAVTAPIHTRCEKTCASAGVLIVANGAEGCRSAGFGTEFVMTGVWAPEGSEAAAEKVLRQLAERLAVRTGQDVEAVITDMRSRRRFTAKEAVEYGLVDKVDEPVSTAP